MGLGYEGPLYILAFDHRGSFQKMVLGAGGQPTAEETERIADAKSVIAEGFQAALDRGAPKQASGILVDEQFGTAIAQRAAESGWTFAMPVEKSGQDEFDFEYREDFAAHIERFDPTFAKVLVRYNPDADSELNRLQSERLARLTAWLHGEQRKFLFELLVPATEAQLSMVGGDSERYDIEVRPGLMLTAITELRTGGVEPDVWKIEGIDRREDCRRVAELVQSGDRSEVSCVVLGRGADSDKVAHWLRQGAGVPGYIGFAIGRTIWSEAVMGYVDGSLKREEAAGRVADQYLWAIDVYEAAAGDR